MSKECIIISPNTYRIQYRKNQILALMAEIENKRNRYHSPKMSFECAFPNLTKEIWKAMDIKKNLAFMVEKLNKLSDTF